MKMGEKKREKKILLNFSAIPACWQVSDPLWIYLEAQLCMGDGQGWREPWDMGLPVGRARKEQGWGGLQ